MKRSLNNTNNRASGKKTKTNVARRAGDTKNARSMALRMQLLHLERVAASAHLTAAEQRTLYQQMSALRYALHKLE